MRLYSPEWVDAFNAAVAGLEPEPGVSFRMLQVVDGGPDGTLRVTLSVGADGGGIALRVERDTGGTGGTPTTEPLAETVAEPVAEPLAEPVSEPLAEPVAEPGREAASGAGRGPATGAGRGREPQVTVMVAYEDAVALARGDVDPATLLRAGRVKVRGDLSALVTGQAILAEAANRLGSLSERTSF